MKVSGKYPAKKKSRKKVVIIIPTHRPYLTKDDEISLKHLKKYLRKYDIFFVIPKNISAKTFINAGYKVKRVDIKFFGTLRRANEALLNKKFYEIFADYEYMLIYQLDVLVFSDQLEKWVNSGYDFIAAPWFYPFIGFLSHKKGSPMSGGNGGFSLRNIQKAIKIIDIVNASAKRTSRKSFIRKLWFFLALLTGKSHQVWLNAPTDNYPFNEDGFWSYEATKYLPEYKVAPFEKALQFSFERFPGKCFKLNKHRLPFGCHAWKKYDQKFWHPYLLT